MAKPFSIVSATIVLFFTFSVKASPKPEIPEGNDPSSPEVSLPPDENMVISPAPNVDSEHLPPTYSRYYPYRQQLTFRAGVASDFPKLGFSDSLLGFQYLFPKFLSPKLEGGADLHENGRGHIHLGARWIYFERSYWRPSTKIALDHFVDAKLGLATLARKEDWYARAGLAAEYVVWNPYSLRAEAEMLANFDNLRVLFSLGLSRGW